MSIALSHISRSLDPAVDVASMDNQQPGHWVAGIAFGKDGQAAMFAPNSYGNQVVDTVAGESGGQADNSPVLSSAQNDVNQGIFIGIAGTESTDTTALSVAAIPSLESTTSPMLISSVPLRDVMVPTASQISPVSATTTAASSSSMIPFSDTNTPLSSPSLRLTRQWTSTQSTSTTTPTIPTVGSSSSALTSLTVSASTIVLISTFSAITDHDTRITSPSVVALPNPSLVLTRTKESSTKAEMSGRIILLTLGIIFLVALTAGLGHFLFKMFKSERRRRKERMSEIILPWTAPDTHPHDTDGQSSSASSILNEKGNGTPPPRTPRYLVKPTLNGVAGLVPGSAGPHSRRFASTSDVPPLSAHLEHMEDIPHSRPRSLPLLDPDTAAYLSNAISANLSPDMAQPQPLLHDAGRQASPAPWLRRSIWSRHGSMSRMVYRNGELVPAEMVFARHLRQSPLPPVDEPVSRQGWASAFKAGMVAAVAGISNGGRQFFHRRAEPDDMYEKDPYTRMPSRRRRTLDPERDAPALELPLPNSPLPTPVDIHLPHDFNNLSSPVARSHTTCTQSSNSSTAVAPSDTECCSPKAKYMESCHPPRRMLSTLSRRSQLRGRSGTLRSTCSNISEDSESEYAESLSDDERRMQALLLQRQRRMRIKLLGLSAKQSLKSVASSLRRTERQHRLTKLSIRR